MDRVIFAVLLLLSLVNYASADSAPAPAMQTAERIVMERSRQSLQMLDRAIEEFGKPLGRMTLPGGRISRRTIGGIPNNAIAFYLNEHDGSLPSAESLRALSYESLFGDLNPETWIPCNEFKQITAAEYVAAARAVCPVGLVDPFNPGCTCTILSPVCFFQSQAHPIEWHQSTYVSTVNRDGSRMANPLLNGNESRPDLTFTQVKAAHEQQRGERLRLLQRRIPGLDVSVYKDPPKPPAPDLQYGMEVGSISGAVTDFNDRGVRLRRLLWEWNAANDRPYPQQWGYKMTDLMGKPPCANHLLLRPDEPFYANTSEIGVPALMKVFPDLAMLDQPLLKPGDYGAQVNGRSIRDIFSAAEDDSWRRDLVPSYLALRNRNDAADAYAPGLMRVGVFPEQNPRHQELVLRRPGVSFQLDSLRNDYLSPLAQDALRAATAFLEFSDPRTPGSEGARRIRRFSYLRNIESKTGYHHSQARPEKLLFTDKLQLLTFMKGTKVPGFCFGAEQIPNYEKLSGDEAVTWSYKRTLFDQSGAHGLHGETAFTHRNLQREVSCEWCGRPRGCMLLHDGDVERNSFAGTIPRPDVPEEFRRALPYWRGYALQAPRPRQGSVPKTPNLGTPDEGSPRYIQGSPPAGIKFTPGANPIKNFLLGLFLCDRQSEETAKSAFDIEPQNRIFPPTSLLQTAPPQSPGGGIPIVGVPGIGIDFNGPRPGPGPNSGPGPGPQPHFDDGGDGGEEGGGRACIPKNLIHFFGSLLGGLVGNRPAPSPSNGSPGSQEGSSATPTPTPTPQAAVPKPPNHWRELDEYRF